jgi:hypothetical protein
MEGSTPPSDTAWAMSEENVEIVRRVYEIIADGFDEETVRTAIANGLSIPTLSSISGPPTPTVPSCASPP